MPSKKHAPIHPGEVLLEDFMKPMGLTAYRVAKDIGVTAQHVGRVTKGERGIGGDLALRLAHYFGTSASLWMGLQSQYELDKAEDAAGDTIRQQVTPREAA